MDIGLLFAILMILWGLTIVGGLAGWTGPWAVGGTVLQWILFALLGWRIFGPLLHG